MATVTITFQDEDSLTRFDVNVFGTVTSRNAPAPIAAFADGGGRDPRNRQTIVVLNTGAITLAEVQRALAASRRVRATAV